MKVCIACRRELGEEHDLSCPSRKTTRIRVELEDTIHPLEQLCAKCQLPETAEIHDVTFFGNLSGTLGGRHAFKVDHVRQEIKDLIRRGNVTTEEIKTIRCNSWEWEALIPAMSDEAFVERMQYTLGNCAQRREFPCTTYDQALQWVWAPELLKRFGVAVQAAKTFEEVVDNVREALGQKETHYLVIADDVKELVDAVERDSSRAKAILLKIRNQPGSGTPRCQACAIEAETGTEENPHPIPSRFHTCPPTYQNAEFGVHIFAGPDGFKPLYERNADGNINNCALSNGDERKNCQVCKEQCPDRARFEVKSS